MAAAQSELSMDEILASIRRIIDEEERPQRLPNPDQTNTVNLKDEAEKAARNEAAAAKPAQPEPQAPAPQPTEPAEQLREARVTSPAPQEPPKAEAAPLEEPVATMEPDADATEKGQAHDETFDPAPARSLAKAPEKLAEQDQPEKASTEPEAQTDEKPAAKDGGDEASEAGDSAAKADPQVAKAVREAQTDAAISALLGDQQAAGVAKAFAMLRGSMQIGAAQQPRTVEGLIEDMLRPMLKEWLDQNLPGIVEAKVEAEIKRLTGQA